MRRLRIRRPAAPSRTWRPGTPARAAPVFLEEREMGARHHASKRRAAWLLGVERLPHSWRPMAGTEVLGRLTWQLGEVTGLVQETPRVGTLQLQLQDWPGHRAGQHVDVRLTAEDGYQAQRSYSIASAPEDEHLMLTVERLDDGEVSPYLVDVLQPGDELELRGPIGGYFVWEESLGGPLVLVGGGSGVVPLRAILRHRVAAGEGITAQLLYSSRTLDDVIYRDELPRLGEHDGV